MHVHIALRPMLIDPLPITIHIICGSSANSRKQESHRSSNGSPFSSSFTNELEGATCRSACSSLQALASSTAAFWYASSVTSAILSSLDLGTCDKSSPTSQTNQISVWISEHKHTINERAGENLKCEARNTIHPLSRTDDYGGKPCICDARYTRESNRCNIIQTGGDIFLFERSLFSDSR